jgi:formimidoylglutamate deiminase
MRGVEPGDIAELAKSGPQDIPFHIHIAEQLKEIEDSLDYLDERPVEWMLNNVDLNDRFHLVHATHLTEEETKGIADCGANVVLCPTTEGNLGDGIFPLNDFHRFGGNWSIGTDSHIGINPFEELRLLDYGQRLISHNRKTFAGKQGDSGQFAIEMATVAGRKAMNNGERTFFKLGEQLNASVLRETALTASSSEDTLLSSILYTTDSTAQYGTIVSGNWSVKDGVHSKRDRIEKEFIETISDLKFR